MQHPHIAVDSLQSTVNSYSSGLRTSDIGLQTSTSRPSRAKRHLAWEQIELESHGFYAESLHDLAARFPILTRMELRICALVKGMLTNWEIAESLHICTETVENHRVNIRRKLSLRPDQNLQKHLLTQR